MTTANAEALAQIENLAKKAAEPRRKMIGIPTDASPEYFRMWHALKRLAARGCGRLVPPSTCRSVHDSPEDQWCEGCIAAEALGIDREWFQLR
jgi:hypothetical protein